MTSVQLRGFRDELVKIALLEGTRNAVRTGWHGPAEGSELLKKNPELKQTWMGFGRAHDYERMGPIGKAWDNITSLGGATKHLPVGAKSMMALSTATQLPGALRAEDPTGQGRSRTERLSGLAGQTVGGLALTGALLNTGMRPLGANLLGGLGGSILGEKLFSAPWHHRRMRQQALARQQMARQQAQPMPAADAQPVAQAAQGEVIQ